MRLDVRVPAGLMLAIIGLLLTGYGLVSDRGIYARSLDINVNLIWGVVLVVAGATMFAFGRRARITAESAEVGAPRDDVRPM